jgi:hypothetical protein
MVKQQVGEIETHFPKKIPPRFHFVRAIEDRIEDAVTYYRQKGVYTRKLVYLSQGQYRPNNISITQHCPVKFLHKISDDYFQYAMG